MSKKTVIIAWRFTRPDGRCHDTKPYNSDYEIIKFYTNPDRNEPINEECFKELIGIISIISSDLFVFIHTPQFKKFKEQLLFFNKPEQNIHIIGFEGGDDFVYQKFINTDTFELKSIDDNSIAHIFEEMTAKYGELESLIHLYKSLKILLLKIKKHVLTTENFVTEIGKIKNRKELKFAVEKFLPNGETVTPNTLKIKLTAFEDEIVKLSTTR